MTATVTRLPTASNTYFTVAKAKGGWAIQLVTPCPGRALRTTVATAADRDSAIAYGQERAAAIQRPFKMPRSA